MERQQRESSVSSADAGSGVITSPSTISFEDPLTKAKTSGLTLRLDLELAELFSENVSAKLWRTAVKLLKEQNNVLSHYPETVPQTGSNSGKWALREADFWTCGFFPGSLYALLERSIKFPQYLNLSAAQRLQYHEQFLWIARTWAEPLYEMAGRTDTHDMGFIIQPALRMDWELTGNKRSLNAVFKAAESLASRFSQKVGAIRSWDNAINHRYSYTDMDADFLVIIDSMCNLDLLYYAGHHTSNQRLIDIATTHAHTVLRAIVRDDFSTYHLINFDAQTGVVKDRLTNQGYKDWSTWSRGQAWAILGFSETYTWTKDPIFLNAAISIANNFLSRLASARHNCPNVPLWDFDAPVDKDNFPLRDTSAGLIAANGLLILQQAMHGHPEGDKFLSAAIQIVKETIDLSLSDDKASFSNEDGAKADLIANEGHFDAILKNATACNHENSFKIYTDHGLVYADYYFVEFGNKLLRLGLA